MNPMRASIADGTRQQAQRRAVTPFIVQPPRECTLQPDGCTPRMPCIDAAPDCPARHESKAVLSLPKVNP